MGAVNKAKRTVIGIEIPRDELALRIAIAAIGHRPPEGVSAAEAFRQMDEVSPGMSDGFRYAADAAVKYFHERVNAGRRPS